MTSDNAKLRAYRRGKWGERFAICLLVLKGYRIIDQRVKTPVGEIDIVARKGRSLVIVEVKTRQSLADAIQALGATQRKRLEHAGSLLFAREQKRTYPPQSIRFYLIAIAPKLQIRHIRGAWQPTMR